MSNFNYIIKENINKHIANWPQAPDHSYRILIVASSGSGKKNALLNLISHHPDVDKIYLYPKDLREVKYLLLVVAKYWKQ